MGCAQTDPGKTGASLIPIVQRLLQSGGARHPDQGRDEEVLQRLRSTSTAYQAGQLEEGCNILVATPSRLHDYAERGRASFSQVQYLVLDEADRMLDMGFKDDIIKMARNPAMPGKGSRRTMMFSATFPDKIKKSNFWPTITCSWA